MKLLDVCYALLPLKLYSVDPNLYPDHCYKASWTIKLGVPEGESGKQIASFQMANRSYELLSLCVIGEICIQSLASFAVLFCYDVCIHQVPGGKTERQACNKLYIHVTSPLKQTWNLETHPVEKEKSSTRFCRECFLNLELFVVWFSSFGRQDTGTMGFNGIM